MGFINSKTDFPCNDAVITNSRRNERWRIELRFGNSRGVIPQYRWHDPLEGVFDSNVQSGCPDVADDPLAGRIESLLRRCDPGFYCDGQAPRSLRSHGLALDQQGFREMEEARVDLPLRGSHLGHYAIVAPKNQHTTELVTTQLNTQFIRQPDTTNELKNVGKDKGLRFGLLLVSHFLPVALTLRVSTGPPRLCSGCRDALCCPLRRCRTRSDTDCPARQRRWRSACRGR